MATSASHPGKAFRSPRGKHRLKNTVLAHRLSRQEDPLGVCALVLIRVSQAGPKQSCELKKKKSPYLFHCFLFGGVILRPWSLRNVLYSLPCADFQGRSWKSHSGWRTNGKMVKSLSLFLCPYTLPSLALAFLLNYFLLFSFYEMLTTISYCLSPHRLLGYHGLHSLYWTLHPVTCLLITGSFSS